MMKNDFSVKRYELERTFEELLIEIIEVTTPKGLHILVDQLPLIKEFNAMIDSVERSYLSDKVMLIPNPGVEGLNDEE